MVGADNQWIPLSAGSMTGTTALTGTPKDIYGCSRVSFQAIWTGTPTGTFTFQIANFPGDIFNADGTLKSTVTWTTLTNPTGFTAMQPGGTAGSGDFSFADLAHKWIRPIYTNTSGTGTLTFVYGSARH